MRLSLISEVQFKSPTTSMERTNLSGQHNATDLNRDSCDLVRNSNKKNIKNKYRFIIKT